MTENDRIAALEQRQEALEKEVAELKRALNELVKYLRDQGGSASRAFLGI